MNLSGETVDTSAKYRINGYDENYCKNVIGRKYVAKYWKPITVKIAIQE